MTEQPSKFLPPDFIQTCDFRSRKAVCAMAWNPKTKRDEIMGFRFNPAIADWPICQQAEDEGWARELRSAMIATVKRMMFAGEAPDPARAIPNEKWIEDTRRHAERYRLAAAQQAGTQPKRTGSFRTLTQRSKAMQGDAA